MSLEIGMIKKEKKRNEYGFTVDFLQSIKDKQICRLYNISFIKSCIFQTQSITQHTYTHTRTHTHKKPEANFTYRYIS